MIKLRTILGVVALTATALTATATDPAASADAAATHYSGVLADGASWIADVPADWNGTTILYSHGYGPLVAQDGPDPTTRQDLLDLGYTLVGSSYSGPSWWALAPAVDDQFGSLTALQAHTGPPRRVIAWGTSMGGLISSLEAERGGGRIAGALTTCGLVGGALNLNDYQLDGEWALSHLLAPGQPIQLVDYASADDASAAASALTNVVGQAQSSAPGRARTALGAALMHEPTWAPDQPQPAPNDYVEQENQQAAELSWVLGFVMTARQQIEVAAAGNSSSTVGVDYAALLRHNPQRRQVEALYRSAGLNLTADLARLTRDADIHSSRAAAASLARSSVPSGRLTVPELDIHTIADQLVPVTQEAWYAGQVRRAGRSALLRQAYVDGTGHCNFQPAAMIAALHALEQRIARGWWADATTPPRLNQAAAATGLGPFLPYIRYMPPPLVTGRR